MGVYTYLSEFDKAEYSRVADPELDQLFQEIREVFGERYFLRTTATLTPRRFFASWFRPDQPASTFAYTLYVCPDGGPEVQVINFCMERSWSINTNVPKSYIMTFFFGLLNGKKFAETNASPPLSVGRGGAHRYGD